MINEFLKSRIEDAKTLVQELNETYEYVSILGNYVKTKKALITTVSSSIDELDNECGFVIKVYKDGHYSEYSCDDIRGLHAENVIDAITISTPFATSIPCLKENKHVESFAREDSSSLTDEEIYQALDIAQAREFVDQKEKGLDLRIEQNGGNLSGGQKQRLTIARALVRNPEILILDEHTAALDPKTAELIMELTGKVVKEKKLTTIMVTHNLRYAIEYGNRLVMMHQGNTILDKKGEEKDRMSVDDILTLFNEISIECGNYKMLYWICRNKSTAL